MLTFTLSNYDLNSLFMSKLPSDVLNFYSYFSDQESLVKWMRERPKRIKNTQSFIRSRKDFVVVIPTKDIDSANAAYCRNTLFPELSIVFVESGLDNEYFNYSYSCNIGFKEALKHNPKWIILSNDDMDKIEPAYRLLNILEEISNDQFDAIFTHPVRGNYHSYQMIVGKPNSIRNGFLRVSGEDNRKQLSLEKKFGIRFTPSTEPNYKKLFKDYYEFVNFGCFGIFSSEFIRKKGGSVFDECYLNEFEEVELSIQLSKSPERLKYIDFKIRDRIGESLGTGSVRKFRAIASRAYFNFKINKSLIELNH